MAEPGIWARLRRVRERRAKTRRNSLRGTERGLWHRPVLMNLLSDLLLLTVVAMLGYAGWHSLERWLVAPINQVVVLSPLRQVTLEQLGYATASGVSGNFLTVDLNKVRTSFEKLPWIRRADVRRRWPNALEIRFEEQEARAYWKVPGSEEIRLVNRYGEVFAGSSNAKLPVFYGPEGASHLLLERFSDYSEKVAPLGKRITNLILSPRQSWQLQLSDGMIIELGSDQVKSPPGDRLGRFVPVYLKIKHLLDTQTNLVDLRYPNGFSLSKVNRVQVEKEDGE